MTETWIVVAGVGAATMAVKALGPVLLGGRRLPPRVASVVRLLAPAVLSALVVTQTFAQGRSLVVDARVAGVAAAVVALRLRAPVLVVVIVAAIAAATIRATA